jgi:hypothetical protein
MAELPRQPAHGGSLVEPAPALLPHRAHSGSVPARSPRVGKRLPPNPIGQKEYVRRVLSAYGATPGTTGNIADKTVSWPLNCINGLCRCRWWRIALVLAAARRLFRSARVSPLGTIRSLAYFLPVIEEVLSLDVSPDYFRYLRHKIPLSTPQDRMAPSNQTSR